MPASPAALAPAHQRAVGRLEITLKQNAGRTGLERFYQAGCLKARCLRGHGVPELVALNISGGIAGGDEVSTAISLAPGAKAVFTTQAAERIYRALDVPSRISTRLEIGAGAHLAYLPQETILFDGFALKRKLEIELTEDASFLGVESLIFGRLAMGEALRSGALHDRITLRRDGRLLWQDVMQVEGDVFAKLDLPGAAGKARAMATIFAIDARQDKVLLEAKLAVLRENLAGHVAGVSIHGNMALLRLLGQDAASLRGAVSIALSVLGEGALPRVWQI